MTYTIKRKDLVKKVKEIVDTSGLAEKDFEQAAAIIGTSLLANQFQLGQWRSKKCGRLIGTLYPSSSSSSADFTVRELEKRGVRNPLLVNKIGISFDSAMRHHIYSSGQADHDSIDRQGTITVV